MTFYPEKACQEILISISPEDKEDRQQDSDEEEIPSQAPVPCGTVLINEDSLEVADGLTPELTEFEESQFEGSYLFPIIQVPMALLLTETVLFYWDCIDFICRENGQVAEAKDEWASVGDVKDWVDKLASQALLSQCFESTAYFSRHTRSISSFGSLIKGRRVTPASPPK